MILRGKAAQQEPKVLVVMTGLLFELDKGFLRNAAQRVVSEQETPKAMLHFLNHAATNLNGKKCCKASGMI